MWKGLSDECKEVYMPVLFWVTFVISVTLHNHKLTLYTVMGMTEGIVRLSTQNV